MKLEKLPTQFSVCKVADFSQVDMTGFCFLAQTDEEYSLVCPTDAVPRNVTACVHGWNAFRVHGQLDFSLVGILSEISSILSRSGISIFAVSTFDTDYILVKSENFDHALSTLTDHGYEII